MLMTEKTTKYVNNHGDLEIKTSHLLDAYRVQLDIFKLQNDNYFKRIQIFMIAIQAGLLSLALRFVSIKSELVFDFVLLFCITTLGIFSAYIWSSLIDKQKQYSEFCRRTLRNIESKLTEVGVPLRYFTLEAHIFGPLRTTMSSSAGTSIRTKENHNIACFDWSNEEFPDTDIIVTKIYSVKKVTGGLVDFEKNIAQGLIGVWFIIYILLIIRWNF